MKKLFSLFLALIMAFSAVSALADALPAEDGAALIRLYELISEGALAPRLVLGAPVGFVNVTESKERALAACIKYAVPAILAMGRKGGSTVAAAILNALLYQAADLTAPESRLG